MFRSFLSSLCVKYLKSVLLSTQVSFSDLVALDKILTSAGQCDFTCLQNIGSVSDGESHLSVLLNKEDCCAVVSECFYNIENLLNENWGKTR